MLRLLREHTWVPNGRIAQSSSPLSGTFLRSTHVFPIESLFRGGLPVQPTRVRRKAVSVPALPRRQAGGLRSVAALQKSVFDRMRCRSASMRCRSASVTGGVLLETTPTARNYTSVGRSRLVYICNQIPFADVLCQRNLCVVKSF